MHSDAQITWALEEDDGDGASEEDDGDGASEEDDGDGAMAEYADEPTGSDSDSDSDAAAAGWRWDRQPSPEIADLRGDVVVWEQMLMELIAVSYYPFWRRLHGRLSGSSAELVRASQPTLFEQMAQLCTQDDVVVNVT